MATIGSPVAWLAWHCSRVCNVPFPWSRTSVLRRPSSVFSISCVHINTSVICEFISLKPEKGVCFIPWCAIIVWKWLKSCSVIMCSIYLSRNKAFVSVYIRSPPIEFRRRRITDYNDANVTYGHIEMLQLIFYLIEFYADGSRITYADMHIYGHAALLLKLLLLVADDCLVPSLT